MKSPGTGWGAELLVVFISGFLLATILWLALWLLWTRPGRGALFQEKEAALRAKESALQNCLAAKDQSEQSKNNLLAQNSEIEAKLKNALIGWGRCIKGKTQSSPQ